MPDLRIDYRLVCLWINLTAFSFFFLDEPIYLYVREIADPVRYFFYFITDLGLSSLVLFPTAAICALCWYCRTQVTSPRLKMGLADINLMSATLFLGVALTGIFAALSKQIIGRARPKLFETLGVHDVDLFAFAHAQASFPSGHTTTIFAFAFIMSLYMPRVRLWVFTLAAWVGISRIVTGAHYTSDVVAGMLVGVVGAILIINHIKRLGFEIRDTRHAGAALGYGKVYLKRKIKRCL